MDIMTAGVADPVHLRLKGKSRLLLNGKGIDIMPDTDRFPLLSTPDQHTYARICLKGLRQDPKLRKALRKIKNTQNKKLFLYSEDTVRCVSVHDIRYIEVREHLLTYHLVGEDITVRGQMDKLETELEGCHFYRIYKSYLVNLDYVVGVGANTVRVGEENLCLSRARKKHFMQTLADYLGSAI